MTIRLSATAAVLLAVNFCCSSFGLAQEGGQPYKGQRIEAFVPLPSPAVGGVQQVGHNHLQSAPGPYGYAGYGYGYGAEPYGYTPPYVDGTRPPDRFWPGRPFDGGRYGTFGSPHRTPGYPHHHFHREYVGPQGPPSAQVAYPYYTTRGPRDFLVDNPPSIGR